jgi:hypothetical protein
MVSATTLSIFASYTFCVARVPTDRSLATKGLSRRRRGQDQPQALDRLQRPNDAVEAIASSSTS